MEKIDIEYLYRAADELSPDKKDGDTLAKLIEYARKLQDEEKEEKPSTPKVKKPFLLLTAEPLKEPILGWIIQKEPEMVAFRNEEGKTEEGIAPQCWGDLEVDDRILKVAEYINSTPKLKKKYGAMSCLGDVMEYAPARVCKEQGFNVKTKQPVAIVPVNWLAEPVDEDDESDYEYED